MCPRLAVVALRPRLQPSRDSSSLWPALMRESNSTAFAHCLHVQRAKFALLDVIVAAHRQALPPEVVHPASRGNEHRHGFSL